MHCRFLRHLTTELMKLLPCGQKGSLWESRNERYPKGKAFLVLSNWNSNSSYLLLKPYSRCFNFHILPEFLLTTIVQNTFLTWFHDEDRKAEKDNLLKVIQFIHGGLKFEPKYYLKLCSLSSMFYCFSICFTFYFEKY